MTLKRITGWHVAGVSCLAVVLAGAEAARRTDAPWIGAVVCGGGLIVLMVASAAWTDRRMGR